MEGQAWFPFLDLFKAAVWGRSGWYVGVWQRAAQTQTVDLEIIIIPSSKAEPYVYSLIVVLHLPGSDSSYPEVQAMMSTDLLFDYIEQSH